MAAIARGHGSEDVRTLLLTQGDVARIVAACGLDEFMDRTIERLRARLRAGDRDHALPVRSGFTYERPHPGMIEWMPYRKGSDHVTVKLVSYHPSNPARGWPSVLATAVRHEIGTGRLRTIAEGVFLTAVRTGAASAVATEILAHPASHMVGLVGAGSQAVTQLHALSRVLDVTEVLVHDVDPLATASFSERVAWMGLAVRPASLEEVERAADVLCTATSVPAGRGPVVAGAALRPHVHVNAVGADFAGKTELPAALLRDALVCPDFPDQALAEGECQQLSPAELGPDLASLARAPAAVAAWRERRTVFDSTGTALEDDVALEVLVELAESLGVGTRIPFEHAPADPRNPYDFSAGVWEPSPDGRPAVAVALTAGD